MVASMHVSWTLFFLLAALTGLTLDETLRLPGEMFYDLATNLLRRIGGRLRSAPVNGRPPVGGRYHHDPPGEWAAGDPPPEVAHTGRPEGPARDLGRNTGPRTGTHDNGQDGDREDSHDEAADRH
jgi:hypothetical protein